MTKQFGKGQAPWSPSRLKLNDRQVDTETTAQPTDRDEGVDVSAWRRIIFSCHPVSPDIDDAACVGWQLRVKVWRWKHNARWGTGRSGGQWYAEEELTISMDGDVANGGPMEYEFPTLDSEKMHFQPVGSEYTPDNWIASFGVYGLVPRVTEDGHSCECESGGDGGGGGGGGGGIVVQNVFDPLIHNDYTYSSLRGDFIAERQSATTIDLSDLDFAVEERGIVAIGIKEAGATSPMRIWYRDNGLRCDYNAATGRITILGFNIAATDEVAVWLEGPSKVDDPTNRARRAKTVNPDAYHVVTDGEFLDLDIAESAADDYFPFMMGQDGYHWLSCMMTLTGDTVVTLEATNDLERDGAETWYDVTQEVLGVASVTIANDAQAFPPQCWVGWRRLRWVVGETGSGGTVKVFMLRSAYGDNWVPVAREGLPALGTGVEVMGQARETQAAAIDEDDSGQLVMNLYKELVLANHTWATQSNRAEEIDPLDTRHVVDTYAETDIDANTVYDYYLDMDGWTDLTIQLATWTAGGGTIAIAVEFSDQDDGTAPAACTYVDVSLRRYGATPILAAVGLAESIGDAAAGAPNPAVPNINVKWAHIEVTIASDPTDAAFEIFARRIWR